MPEFLPLIPSPSIIPMPEDTSIAPDQVRYFDLSLRTTRRRINLRYRNAGIDQITGVDAASKWADLDAKIKRAVRTGKFQNTGRARWTQPTRPLGRPGFGISLMVPLAHTVGKSKAAMNLPDSDRCFYVIRLDTGPTSGNGVNWSYSSSFHPFTTADQADDRHKVFSNACHLSKGSTVREYRSNIEQASGTYGQPKWAGFLFDFKHLRTLGLSSPYSARFNIHVEVLDDRTGNRLPLIIDPDVGHPGGSYPP